MDAEEGHDHDEVTDDVITDDDKVIMKIIKNTLRCIFKKNLFLNNI